MSTIKSQITFTKVLPNGEIEDRITESMFNIDDVEKCISASGKLYIKFRGLNGTVPLSYFEPEARNKIRIWLKRKNAPLKKVIDGN